MSNFSVNWKVELEIEILVSKLLKKKIYLIMVEFNFHRKFDLKMDFEMSKYKIRLFLPKIQF